MLQQIDPEKGMRQRHAARGGLFQELAFLEPICSRNSTPPSITRPAAKSASSRAGADSSSGITRRSSAFARERKPMPAPSVHASMLSRVPAGTSAMSCLFLISYCTHSARSASSSFFAFRASSTRSTRPLPPPFRSAVVRSSRWRRRRPSGRHPSSKPSDNAASPSAAFLRRPVPEIFIACHPSSSAIRARSPRSVVPSEPRGPARRMRQPGAPSPSQIPSRKSSLTDAPSLRKAGRRAAVASSGTGPVFTMAHPSFGSRCPEPAEFSRHGRKSPAAQSLQGMERVKQDQPGKPRRHHADACTILGQMGQKNGICRSVHSRKGSARPQTESALPHPDLQAPGLHVRNLAQSILSACSVCRPISPDSMASGKPVLGMMQIPYLRLRPRFIETKDMLHIYTNRHCQPMLYFDICACPSPVMISCSE